MHFHGMSLCTLFQRPVNAETLSRPSCDYKRGSKGFSHSLSFENILSYHEVLFVLLPLRAMFRNAGQPRWDVLSSAWSRCLHTGPQGHLGQRKFYMPSARLPSLAGGGLCSRSGEHLGYLGNLHLLLPRANALLQPPEFLLGPHVLGDAGSLVFRHLAAQTLVESLLPATLLRKHQRRRGASAERENVLERVFTPTRDEPPRLSAASLPTSAASACGSGRRCSALWTLMSPSAASPVDTHTRTGDKKVPRLPFTHSLPCYLV